jgi:apolipoprotein N-acyltransferase
MRHAMGRAAVFALVWTFCSLWFIAQNTTAGMVVLCIYTSLYYVLALLGVRVLARRGVWSAVFGSAAMWALVEIARSRLPVFGFPWLLLGHAASEWRELRQAADLLGVYGLSFLIVSVNAALAFLVPPLVSARVAAPPGSASRRRYCLACVACLLLATLIYGRWRLGALTPLVREGARVALIQGCAYQKIGRTQDEKWQQLRQHLKLHAEAARPTLGQERPDLIGWAETMAPGTFNQDPYAKDLLKCVAEFGVPTLCGADWIHPDDLELPILEQRWYNAAFVLDGSGRELAHYAKRRLVPFGEYVPLRSALPFLHAFGTVTRDTYTPGASPSPVVRVAGADFALNVCIEDCHPDLAREAAWRGASAFLNVTNDAWFAGTHAVRSHLQAASFRAIELRRPLVRATNSGVSAQVTPLGDVQVAIPPDHIGVGRLRLALLSQPQPRTPAMYMGEFWVAVLLCLVLIGGWLADARRERGRLLQAQRSVH